MYLWVIIATFFVAIMVKGFAVRDDYDDFAVVPKAEGVIMNLKVLHDVALKYTIDNPSTYVPGCVATSGCPNLINASDLPMGFKNPFSFKSYILCLDPNDTAKVIACDGTTWNYIATFGKVPQHWQHPVTKAPKKEFNKAVYNVSQNLRTGIIKQIPTKTTDVNSTVAGTNFVIDTYRGYTFQKTDSNIFMMGIPAVVISAVAGTCPNDLFLGGTNIGYTIGVACPGDVIYLQNIFNPDPTSSALPAPVTGPPG